MQELKCPDCGHLNPDIREIGYSLPRTCGACPHVWRLQDLGPFKPPTLKEAQAFLADLGLTPNSLLKRSEMKPDDTTSAVAPPFEQGDRA